MASGWVRALIALPVVGAGVAFALTVGDSTPRHDTDLMVEPVEEQPKGDSDDAPALATHGKGKLVRRVVEKLPPEPEAPPALLKAYAQAVKLHKADKSRQALALLHPFLKDHAAWFAIPEHAKFLAALRKRIDTMVKTEIERVDDELERWVDIAKRWGELREDEDASAFERRVRASAEIIGRAKGKKARAAIMRHVRRFLLGTPARSRSGVRLRQGEALDVDALLQQVEGRPRPTIEPLDTPPEDEVERRRLEELDRLRNAGALDLLDTLAGALAWLALHQTEEGWFSDRGAKQMIEQRAAENGEDADTSGLTLDREYRLATTALATMAFLDFRDQDLRGLFEPTLARSVAWLLSQQKENGSFNQPGRSFYGEAIALMALAQAAKASQREDLKQAVTKGLTWLHGLRGPGGGYRYRARQPGDLSASAWVAQAQEMAGWAGIELPEEQGRDLERFVRSTWIKESQFRYLANQKWHRHSLSSAGMLAALILFPADIDADTKQQWKTDLVKQWPRDPKMLYTRYYSVRMISKLYGGLPKQIAQQLLAHARFQRGANHLAGAFQQARYLKTAGVTGVTALTALMFEHALYER